MAQHEIQRIRAVHHKIIDLALAGLTNVQIAEEMDRTPVSIGLILNAPIVQDELARRRKTQNQKHDEATANTIQEVRKILEANGAKAAMVHAGIIENEGLDPRVRQASANSILDRIYGDKTTGGSQTVVQISIEQLENLQVALAESV